MDALHAYVYVCAHARPSFMCMLHPSMHVYALLCMCTRIHLNTCTHVSLLVDFAGKTPLPDVLHHDLDQSSPLLQEFRSKVDLLKAVAAHPLGW